MPLYKTEPMTILTNILLNIFLISTCAWMLVFVVIFIRGILPAWFPGRQVIQKWTIWQAFPVYLTWFVLYLIVFLYLELGVVVAVVCLAFMLPLILLTFSV